MKKQAIKQLIKKLRKNKTVTDTEVEFYTKYCYNLQNKQDIEKIDQISSDLDYLSSKEFLEAECYVIKNIAILKY